MKETPAEDGFVTCSSTTWDYKISGNYQPISSLSRDYYILIKGGGFGNMTSGSLSPFRIRLKTAPIGYGTRSISGFDENVKITLVVDGEEISPNEVSPEVIENIYFDLQGRRIESQDAKGMIIRNGKVVFIK